MTLTAFGQGLKLVMPTKLCTWPYFATSFATSLAKAAEVKESYGGQRRLRRAKTAKSAPWLPRHRDNLPTFTTKVVSAGKAG